MGIHPHRHRDVVDDLGGKNAIAVHFPGVQYLAAQGQNRLAFLVTALLRGAACTVTFHEKEFVAGDVVGFAVGEFAGEHRNGRALFLFHLLRLPLALLGLADHEVGKFLTLFNMVVQPKLKLRAHKTRDKPQGIAACELFLGLPLKLGIEGLTGKDETRACKNVFREKFHALGHQAVGFHKGLHGAVKAVSESRFMRTARRRRNEVYETFAR